MKLEYMIFLLATYSGNLLAGNIGNPSSGGTGCTADSSVITYDEELGLVTVSTPRMIATVGDSTGKKIDRLSCNLSIPIHLEADEQVVVYEFHSHGGYVKLEPNSSAALNVEVFFAGSLGSQMTDKIESTKSTIRSKLKVEQVDSFPKSNCGVDINLRVNSSIRLSTGSLSASSKAKVDGYSFFISIEQCN